MARQESIYIEPYVYTAFVEGVAEESSVRVRKIDPRCPGPNCPASSLGKTIVQEQDYGNGSLVELHYANYDGGRLWVDWKISGTQMGWAQHTFGSSQGWENPPGQTEAINNGDIASARAAIKARVLD